jgi:beta-lactamase class A
VARTGPFRYFSGADEHMRGWARQYSWVPRTRTLLVTLAATAMLAGVGMIGWGMRDSVGLADTLPTAAGAAASRPSAGPSAAPAPSGPTPEQRAARERKAREAALTRALDAYAKQAPEFSVSVRDNTTGKVYAYRGKEKYETASVVKVDILAALLLDAQDEGRDLTANELALAQRMIRASDNDATSALFRVVGRSSGLAKANKRLGLRSTVVNSAWGLTRTTVADQATLLGRLAGDSGPLDAESRTLALGLMGTVQADQRWGVSAAARPGERTAIKNGWLPRSTEGGRWIINSVGRITGDGVDVSLAVLSHGHGSMDAGVTAVEKVSRLTRTHLKW